MEIKVLFMCLVILLTGCTSVGSAQPSSKVSDELCQEVKKDGVVRVLVRLNVPVEPEANLDKDAVDAQRRRISEAQKALLKELAGTEHVFLGGAITLPSAGFSVEADALAILEKSALVTQISESKYTPLQKFELREVKP